MDYEYSNPAAAAAAAGHHVRSMHQYHHQDHPMHPRQETPNSRRQSYVAPKTPTGAYDYLQQPYSPMDTSFNFQGQEQQQHFPFPEHNLTTQYPPQHHPASPSSPRSGPKSRPTSMRRLSARESSGEGLYSPPPLMTLPGYGQGDEMIHFQSTSYTDHPHHFHQMHHSPPPPLPPFPFEQLQQQQSLEQHYHQQQQQQQHYYPMSTSGTCGSGADYGISVTNGNNGRPGEVKIGTDAQLPQHQNNISNISNISNNMNVSISANGQPYSQHFPIDSGTSPAPLAPTTPRNKRPKSLSAHDTSVQAHQSSSTVTGELVDPNTGQHDYLKAPYIPSTTSSPHRQSLPAKSRQSISAIIPQVPHSWVHQQQQQQQQQQGQTSEPYPPPMLPVQHYQQATQSSHRKSRQSFHELEYQQQQQQQQQQYHPHQHQHHRQHSNSSSAAAVPMDIARYRLPSQGSASPHRREQTSGGLEMPLSPNPPLTPSSTSNSYSNGSPLTAMTSPQSSGRSSSGYQPPVPMLPPSPSSHYRKKSFSSGPISTVAPSEALSKAASSDMMATAPASPYGSTNNSSSSKSSLSSQKKNVSSEIPYAQFKDQYRRSESYNTLKARVSQQQQQQQQQDTGAMDISSTNHPVPSDTSREGFHGNSYLQQQPYPTSAHDPMRDQEMLYQPADSSNSSMLEVMHQGEPKRDSWREQEQYLLALQQRDHQTREKHKRESFYAALSQNQPNATGYGYDQGEAGSLHPNKQHLSRGPSRVASPHMPSSIPQPRTKSRSGVSSTPSVEMKGRPTPPPRSRSRTPGGVAAAAASTTGTNAMMGTQTSGAPVPVQPQVPQYYSGEIYTAASRKSQIMAEGLKSEARRSPGSTSSSKSGTPLPQTADNTPLPVADITRHLGGLEFKEPVPKAPQMGMVASAAAQQSTLVSGHDYSRPVVAAAFTAPGVPSATPSTDPQSFNKAPLTTTTASATGSTSSSSLRKQLSTNGQPASHRRSIVFDIPPTHGHTRSSGMESNVGKMKDVGVMIASAKERSSMIAPNNSNSSSARKRGKTLSAMDPPKVKPAPVVLPPMYMSTTSRLGNPSSTIAGRSAASKIPSPSGTGSRTKDPKHLIVSANGTVQQNTSAVLGQDVKTIRGGAPVAPLEMPSSANTSTSSINNFSATTPSGSFVGSTSGGRKSTTTTTLTSPNASSSNSAQMGTVGSGAHATAGADESVTPRTSLFSKSNAPAASARLPSTSSHLLGQPELKKTPTSGLRTPTTNKEPRASPSAGSQRSRIQSPNPQPPLTPTQPGDSNRSAPGGTAVSPFPALSPYAALKLYAPYLSLYERAEIGEYPQVYYVGQNCRQKRPTNMEAAGNFGFDDERGDYLIMNHDHLMFRYEILDTLGKGSFGQVVKCYDHKTGDYLAIKIIRNKKRFHCQALVEVKILSNLVKWDPEDKHNLIRMTDNFYFRNHLCIATELLSINLYEFIKSNSFEGFSLGLIKRFCTQLLQTLDLLSAHRVVHCDLKPENVLLKHPTKSSIKVIDFGSSCLEHEKVYTYIQSRFYRSPEVILGMSYNMAIDMWSLGCILAELYTGYPLFPGENEQEQLACIMEIQGVPDRYIIEKSSRRKLFFDSNGNPRLVINSKGKKRRPGSKTLAHALKCNDVLFLDFLSRCLVWDPEKRMKPREGLRHEWISDIRPPVRAPFSPLPGQQASASQPSLLENGTPSRRRSTLFGSQGASSSSLLGGSTSSKPIKVRMEQDDGSVGKSASKTLRGHPGYISNSGASFSSGNLNYGVPSQHHHQQQQQQQQQQHYPNVYGTNSSNASTLSSAAARRLTVGGELGAAYMSGSRKNATSMYVTGSSASLLAVGAGAAPGTALAGGGLSRHGGIGVGGQMPVSVPGGNGMVNGEEASYGSFRLRESRR
ncbi:hypothetical protein BGZ73_005927 [Actinomortierella ambigua]|nr:hypothetical protein BGZ73_005927 [Actinomortierella ambigua]